MAVAVAIWYLSDLKILWHDYGSIDNNDDNDNDNNCYYCKDNHYNNNYYYSYYYLSIFVTPVFLAQRPTVRCSHAEPHDSLYTLEGRASFS